VRAATAAVLVTGLGLTVACGRAVSAPDPAVPAPEPAVPAPERGYAATVCGEVGSWLRTISASLKDLSSGAPGRTSVAEEREAVEQHLDEVQAATQGLANDVRIASLSGEPGGGIYAGLLLESLREVETAIVAVRERLPDTPARSIDRYRGEVGPLLGRRMGRAVAETLGLLTPASTGALTDRFLEEPTCDGIFSPGADARPQPG
jgi:hypothetical protein